MKNKFLAGAAVIGTMLTVPAYAADDAGVKLNLAGFFKGYVSYVNQDEAAGQSVNKVDIIRQTEIHFDGKTKLDNGLTVGAHIESLADGGDGFDVDESYIYFSNDYGKVNFGRTFAVPFIMQVIAPSADTNVDSRNQHIQPINFTAAGLTGSAFTETDYDQDVSGKVDKLSYISPVFSGLQAGISFTPDASGTSRSLTGNSTDNDAADRSSIWEGAVRFENKPSDTFSYVLGGGYSKAQAETSALNDREAWNVGADFNIGDFGVGASYYVDDMGSSTKDVKHTVVGADYTVGQFLYGTSYYNKNDDVNSVDINRYSAGVTYKAIPGLSFRASAHYYDIEQGSNDVNATAFLLGTDIKF